LAVRLLGSLAALLGLLVLAPTASATHIQCGDVITESVKLDSDVVCPADFEGSALVIGADNLTVDLRGFSVLASTYDAEQTAITTDRPHRNVTLRRGTLAGVSWEATPLSVELSDSVIRDLDAEGLGGFYVFGDRNVVRDNHVFASFSGMGIRGDFNRVVGNEVRAVEGYGIGASGRGFELARNNVTLDRGYGFHDAITVSNFEDIEIQRNVVSAFASDGIEIGRGSGALIDHNIAVHNVNGIRVDELASEVVVRRNQANDNYSSYSESGTGIRVDSASTVIERNTANNNFEYGIWAVPGVTDGGGNRASGNGIANCVNVACR
jgi:hypothetical protein